MEGRQFDEIALALVEGTSRRSVVRTLVAGVLSTMAASTGVGGLITGDSEAKSRHKAPDSAARKMCFDVSARSSL